MIYSMFQGEKLSKLGFGAMRLPLREDGSIDQEQVEAMVDRAMASGVNYYDTAYPYHGGLSEISIGKALARYPRESWNLATKYPGHQIASSYDPAEIFEEQLEKCGVRFFDYYLLHNINESSIGTYMDPKWGMLDYFVRQKELGRIRHLGFSCHSYPEGLEQFLDYAGDRMEFCQIQLNYLDWTLQNAERKCEILNSRGIPVWVMEPVRGGRLAELSPEDTRKLKELRPEESTASWAFRWLMRIPGVTVILSGMSSLLQMEDNLRTFSSGGPLDDGESGVLLEIADRMKNALPCTRCRYCCDGCPAGLDIPLLIHAYNDQKFTGSNFNLGMQFDALPKDRMPSACLGCGACVRACPQNIDIPKAMAELAELVKQNPDWAALCRQREEENRRNKAAKKR